MLNAIFERRSEWIGVRIRMSVHDYKIVVDAGSRIVVLKVGSFDLGRAVYVIWGGLASSVALIHVNPSNNVPLGASGNAC